jgi:hypothetical protein
MKWRLLIVALTILVFAAGFGASIWTERYCPLLMPPVPLLREIGDQGMNARFQLDDPAAVARINAEIERIKPALAAFRAQLDAINQDFHQRVDALLTPEQRVKFEKMHKRYEERRKQRTNAALPTVETSPAGRATIKLPFLSEPIEGMTSFIVVPLPLDHLTAELQLDDRQKAAVRRLLLERREKFLQLIDSTPRPASA